MKSEWQLSWPASIALALTLSFAASLAALGLLERAEPTLLFGRLADLTIRLIGHSGSRWILAYSAVFAFPISVAIAVLRRSRLQPVLLRSSGLASVIAMFVGYWPWRFGDIRDILPVLLLVSVIPLLVLHSRGKWIFTRWIGIVDLVLYFGLFAFLFTRVLYVRVVLLFPATALITSILWARELKLAASVDNFGQASASPAPAIQ